MLEDVIKEYGGEEVTALEVYADVFRFGKDISRRIGPISVRWRISWDIISRMERIGDIIGLCSRMIFRSI